MSQRSSITGRFREAALHENEDPVFSLRVFSALSFVLLPLIAGVETETASPMKITVGASKTEAGAGRVLFLNDRALTVLKFWAGLFPDRLPKHYVFPHEKYGLAQRKDERKGSTQACVHNTDPTRPIGRWKEAWETAKKAARVTCRFHDLRHTGCTRMLEGGIPFSVVASVMGWSASTTVRMSRRYGHIGQAAQQRAMETLSGASLETDGAQNWAQSEQGNSSGRSN